MKRNFLLLSFSFLLILNWSCKKDDDGAVVVEDDNPIPAGPIVVNNTGFEYSPSGWPDGWWHRNEPYKVEWTNEDAFSGNYSVSITSDTLVDDFNYWGQTITENIQPGKKLILRVNIKTVNVEGEGASIVIRGDNTPTPQGTAELFISTQGDIFIGGTHNWKEYSVKLEEPISPSILSISIYLVLLPYTTGQIFFDDITLTYE